MAEHILFVSHAPRHEYLTSLVMRGKARHGWRVSVLGQSENPKPYTGIIDRDDDYYFIPSGPAPQAWEQDEERRKEILGIARSCENLARLPISRIVLAAERSIGRGYGAEFYHWPEVTTTRRVMSDNREPERVILRLLAKVEDMLDRARPDLVLMGQSSSPQALVTALAAKRRKIPIRINRTSKILSHRNFWTDDIGMQNAAATAAIGQRFAENATVSDQATRFLQEFRQKPRTVAYIQRNWDQASRRNWARRHASIAIHAAQNIRSRLQGHEVEAYPLWGRLFELYGTAFRRYRQASYFQAMSEAELASRKYIFLALHKEPELALNLQNPLWHSQKNLISWISANLPAGFRLLVREHRLNAGRRPTSYYKTLLSYPGVDLIDAFDSQFKYIVNAEAIITENGSAGWEGLIFGKRVITIGENYYNATRLTAHVENPARLGEVILDRLGSAPVPDQAEWDKRLCWLIDAEYETTFPEQEADLDACLDALRT